MTTSASTPRQTNTTKASLIGAIMALSLLGACGQRERTQRADASDPATPASASVAETSPQTAPSDSQAAPRATKSSAQSVPGRVAPKVASESKDVAAGKAASIAGGWVNAGGACDSGASVQFNPDGTYMSEGENGTWALSGKTLTVTTSPIGEGEKADAQGPDESTGDTGEKAILTVLSVTEDSAKVILSNGSNASWTRCNS